MEQGIGWEVSSSSTKVAVLMKIRFFSLNTCPHGMVNLWLIYGVLKKFWFCSFYFLVLGSWKGGIWSSLLCHFHWHYSSFLKIKLSSFPKIANNLYLFKILSNVIKYFFLHQLIAYFHLYFLNEVNYIDCFSNNKLPCFPGINPFYFIC